MGCHSSPGLCENFTLTKAVAAEQHSMVGNRVGTPDNADKFVPEERLILSPILCVTRQR